MRQEDTRGVGILLVDGEDFEVTYGLTTTEHTGWGQIIGEHNGLYAALLAHSVMLTLKDGRIAPIVVTDYSAGMGVAEFKLAGAILGRAE